MAIESNRRELDWNKIVGPFYSAREVARELHLTEDEVAKQLKESTILGLKTLEGSVVFPTYQFIQGEDGESRIIIPGLPEVLSEFIDANDAERWTLSSWLIVGQRKLDHKSVVDYLKEKGDLKRAVDLAHDIADRWAH